MRKKPYAKILLLLSFAVFIELFIFNYKHWCTLFQRPIVVKEMIYGSAFTENEDGSLRIGEGEQTVEIRNISARLQSSRIEVEIFGEEPDHPAAVSIWQAVTDDSHQDFYGIGDRVIYPSLRRSQYLMYHLYGNAHDLRIGFSFPQNAEVRLGITLNPRVPMMFSIGRMLVVLCLLLLLYAFRPASLLYRLSYGKLPYRWLLFVLIVFFLVNALICNVLTNVNPLFSYERGEWQQQYQYLAEALSQGSFSLKVEVPEILKELDNPYDRGAREQAFEGTGQWYRWDHAYYNGKYYVYFGVVPVLLFYLPVYLLTGAHLPNHTMIFVAALLFLFGVIGTLNEITKRYFPRLSLGMWLLLSQSVFLGSNLIYMTKRPDLYTVPILTGLAFGFIGLWLFLKADAKDGIRYRDLGSGAFFTALVAGCRPQLFLIFAFFFVLYGQRLFQKKTLHSEAGRQVLLEVAVPMFAVALFLMYYNVRRFGSPFDFGANYNLNFNDMRRRGWVWGRIPLGLFASLLQPVKIIQNFPFEEPVFFQSNYPGVTIQEATFGGLLATTPFAWLGLGIPVFFAKYKKICRPAAWIGLLSLVVGLCVMMVDVEGAGILYRYFDDFSVFFMLPSFCAAGMLLQTRTLRKTEWFRALVWFLLAAFFVRLCHEAMIFFLDTGEELRESRPELFAQIKTLVAFWL